MTFTKRYLEPCPTYHSSLLSSPEHLHFHSILDPSPTESPGCSVLMWFSGWAQRHIELQFFFITSIWFVVLFLFAVGKWSSWRTKFWDTVKQALSTCYTTYFHISHFSHGMESLLLYGSTNKCKRKNYEEMNSFDWNRCKIYYRLQRNLAVWASGRWRVTPNNQLVNNKLLLWRTTQMRRHFLFPHLDI